MKFARHLRTVLKLKQQSNHFSNSVSCGQAPLLVQSRYPSELKLWKDFHVQEKNDCLKAFHEMLDDVEQVPSLNKKRGRLQDRLQGILDYIVNGDHIWTNLTVFYTKTIKGKSIKSDDLRDARILSNLMTLMVANDFTFDDVIDGKLASENRPSWHRQQERRDLVDGAILILAEYELLRRYFGKTRHYNNIADTISRSHLNLHIGRVNDLEFIEENLTITPDQTPGVKFELFNLETHEQLPCLKSSAVVERAMKSALHLCDTNDATTLRKAEEITDSVGKLMHITGNWFDWARWDHSDIENNRHLGRDIRLGKPSWSAAVAWADANEGQRRLLKKYYGVNESQAVDQVIRLYKELGVPEKHVKYEKDACDRTFKLIDQWDAAKTSVPREMLPAAFADLFIYYSDDFKSFRSKSHSSV